MDEMIKSTATRRKLLQNGFREGFAGHMYYVDESMDWLIVYRKREDERKYRFHRLLKDPTSIDVLIYKGGLIGD